MPAVGGRVYWQTIVQGSLDKGVRVGVAGYPGHVCNFISLCVLAPPSCPKQRH
jgi:hypothetical protein